MVPGETTDRNNEIKSKRPKRGLGRGINSLLQGSKGNKEIAVDKVEKSESSEQQGEMTMNILIGSIEKNPYQPRKEFNQDKLAELSSSIKNEGILQPLIVTDSIAEHEGRYTLVAGNRRLLAAEMAGMTTVPCIVRNATERQLHEWALIENIQRTDRITVFAAITFFKINDYYIHFVFSHPTSPPHIQA